MFSGTTTAVFKRKGSWSIWASYEMRCQWIHEDSWLPKAELHGQTHTHWERKKCIWTLCKIHRRCILRYKQQPKEKDRLLNFIWHLEIRTVTLYYAFCSRWRKITASPWRCWFRPKQHFQTLRQWVASFILHMDSDRWFIRFISKRVTPQGWRKFSWQQYLRQPVEWRQR